jgi:hypothetical protein
MNHVTGTAKHQQDHERIAGMLMSAYFDGANTSGTNINEGPEVIVEDIRVLMILDVDGQTKK